jgi:hypothetical protein
VGQDLSTVGPLTALAVGMFAGLVLGIRLGVKWYREAAAAAREDHALDAKRPPPPPR